MTQALARATNRSWSMVIGASLVQSGFEDLSFRDVVLIWAVGGVDRMVISGLTSEGPPIKLVGV